MQNYNTGCTPLHYAIFFKRSNILVGLVLQACPSAMNITNHMGRLPLDFFFLYWYEPIQILLPIIEEDSPNLSGEQILEMKLVITRTNRITVRNILNLLLRQKITLDVVVSNPSDMSLILHSALHLNYCLWLFCKLLAHIHAKDIFEAEEDIILPI